MTGPGEGRPLVSVPGAGSVGPASSPAFRRMSSDGSKIFFDTAERLVAADQDADQDAYQRSGGVTTLISIEAGPPNGIPPATTIDSGPSGTITDSTPTFAFSTNEAGSSFECKVDGGAFAACTSPTTPSLGAGSHSFQVRATDVAGNVDASPASSAFTVVLDTCGGKTPTMIGTEGADVLTGTGGVDVVVGLGGKDKLKGLGAGDLLCGGAGNDTLIGGGGADKLFGQAGNDTLRGGPAKDKLVGGPGRDKQTP